MESTLNITAILIANIIGFCLMFVLIASNSWRLREHTVESRFVICIAVMVLVACVLDPLSSILDGQTGFPGTLSYLFNWILYFTNLILVPLWLNFICAHMSYKLPKPHLIFIVAVEGFGLGLLLVNFFTPIVFGVSSDGYYYRGDAYWYFLTVEIVFLFDGLILYFLCRQRGGVLKFFPIWLFVLPTLLGMMLQTMFYGVSTIWPLIAVSVAGVMMSLQNELIFRDKLTGLYNRFYLDYLREEALRTGQTRYTAMMLDLNGFKHINDTYGHAMGDEAIIAAAKIFNAAVGTLGSVLRYAGDEFVVILNTTDSTAANEVLATIQQGLEAHNAKEGVPYTLSAACGHSTLDLSTQSVDEVINEVDRLMFENKRAYYETHAGADRRQRRSTDQA